MKVRGAAVGCTPVSLPFTATAMMGVNSYNVTAAAPLLTKGDMVTFEFFDPMGALITKQAVTVTAGGDAAHTLTTMVKGFWKVKATVTPVGGGASVCDERTVEV